VLPGDFRRVGRPDPSVAGSALQSGSRRLAAEAFALIGRRAERILKRSVSAPTSRKSLPRLRHPQDRRAAVKKLLACGCLCAGDPTIRQTYEKIGRELDRIEARSNYGNRLFYLATPPSRFWRQSGSPSRRVGPGAPRTYRAKTTAPGGASSSRSRWHRCLGPARSIANWLSILKDEDQIVPPSDHYLGRRRCRTFGAAFATALFEPIWNRDHIDHVADPVAEALTVGPAAGNYYDAMGALRDMCPNHLFQLLSLIAMEPPARFAARRGARRQGPNCSMPCSCRTRDEALRNSVRAQYAEGTIDNRASRPIATPRT